MSSPVPRSKVASTLNTREAVPVLDVGQAAEARLELDDLLVVEQLLQLVLVHRRRLSDYSSNPRTARHERPIDTGLAR
jgi:hypothetical protein